MCYKKIFILISMAIIMSVNSIISTEAATENDLREVMGIGRLDTDKNAKIQAIQTIRDCTKDKQHNELVDMLSDYDLDSYTEQMELANQGEMAYEKIMTAFKEGKPVEAVIKDLSVYETYYNNWVAEPTRVSYNLQKIDEKNITQRMKYAEDILATINSTDDIGTVGINGVTPTKEERLIISELSEDSMTFQTVRKQKIYAILNGTVESVGMNYITIKCGSTVRLTYYGVMPFVEKEQRVRQGRKIGTAIRNNAKISMVITGNKENPILMYGKKGISWYENFQSENAMDYGDRIFLNTDHVKDYPEEGAKKTQDSEINDKKEQTEKSPFDNKNEDVLLDKDPFIQIEQAPNISDQTEKETEE